MPAEQELPSTLRREKGPSDPQAARRTARPGRTRGGVDMNADKQHLYDLAKQLDVRGRSKMTKQQLVEAIDKANQRETAKARR